MDHLPFLPRSWLSGHVVISPALRLLPQTSGSDATPRSPLWSIRTFLSEGQAVPGADLLPLAQYIECL